jgi:glucokinase
MPVTIGVDVGGTKILGVAHDGRQVVAEHRVATPSTGEGILDAMEQLIETLRVQSDADAVGVGSPGLVDKSGVLRFAPNLPGVIDLPVGAHLAAATGLRVEVDNDALCALRGELAVGAVGDARNVVLLTFGTGVGSGLLVDGRIVRGAHGFAGEAGHVVVDRDGVPCPCGRRGCWERYASGTGLGRMGRELAEAGRAPRLTALAGGSPDLVKGEHVTTAAAEGDEPALGVVDAFAGWVALGLVNLTQLLDVERFVIGGGVVESAPVLIAPIRTAFADWAVSPEHRPAVDIVPAMLGEHAGAIGAALLARDRSPETAEGPTPRR